MITYRSYNRDRNRQLAVKNPSGGKVIIYECLKNEQRPKSSIETVDNIMIL